MGKSAAGGGFLGGELATGGAFPGLGVLAGASTAMTGQALGNKLGGGGGGGKKSGGGSSGIPQPDFMGLANQQSVQSHNNIYTPQGSFTWAQDANGQWTGKENLDPNTQASLTGQQQMQAQRTAGAQGMLPGAMDQLGQGVDYAGLGQIQDGSGARDQAIHAAYGQATSRLDPQFQQQETSLRNRLYGQGLREGDQAFDTQIANFGRTRNDAYTSAMNSAIGQGTAAQQATFGQNLAARQQNINEQQANQYQGLNAMNALMNGQQVAQPGFPGLAQPGANLLGAAGQQYQSGLDAYNARMGMLNGALPGLGPFLFG